MPAPALDVNWEAVKAHALQHGIRPTAEHYGIAVGTLFARSSREGWLKPVVPTVPATMQLKASNACTPAKAALNALETLGNRSKLALVKATCKASTTLSRMPAEEILDRTGPLKDLVSAGKTLHNWGSSEAPSLVLNLAVTPAAITADPFDMLKSYDSGE